MFLWHPGSKTIEEDQDRINMKQNLNILASVKKYRPRSTQGARPEQIAGVGGEYAVLSSGRTPLRPGGSRSYPQILASNGHIFLGCHRGIKHGHSVMHLRTASEPAVKCLLPIASARPRFALVFALVWIPAVLELFRLPVSEVQPSESSRVLTRGGLPDGCHKGSLQLIGLDAPTRI